MNRAGIILLVVGAILVAIAFWKFRIDGFYPYEVLPFAIVGIAGFALGAIGIRIIDKQKFKRK